MHCSPLGALGPPVILPVVARRARGAVVGFVLGALGALAAPAAAQAPAQVKVQVNYDGSVPLSAPDYEETLANLWYPLGKGPVDQGYPVEPLPVMISVRGGNTNSIPLGGGNPDEMTPFANDFGLIGVTCNFPLVGPGEDYRVASAGLGLLVQYLRANATQLNVAPDRIMMQSRSFGTVATYPLALKEDFADPGATDPVLTQSSRPDYFAPRFGPSTLTCFSSQAGPWDSTLSVFFFPGQTFDEGTPAQRLEESAYWWLTNPHEFDRERTPPLCVVYKSDHPDRCGDVTDPHSGIFGDIMLEAIDDYVALTGDREFRERSGSVDIALNPDASGGIIAWAVKRLAEDFDGLWLAPPVGVAGPAGGDIALNAFGAAPGATVSFFVGTVAGTFPMPGCPDLEGQIADFAPVGTATASPGGLATLIHGVDAASIGQTVLFHAVDLGGCEMSNVSVHTYY